MAELGRLPQAGDTVEHDGYRLIVTRVQGRRAARIRVVPAPDGSAPVATPTA
jgi:putative hemolysin